MIHVEIVLLWRNQSPPHVKLSSMKLLESFNLIANKKSRKKKSICVVQFAHNTARSAILLDR